MRAVVLIVAAVLAGAGPAWGRAVRVVVRVPAGTDGAVYLAGSLAAVGGWRADGVRLDRLPDGTVAGTVELPVGAELQFKLTRGTWDTVERRADGADRDNRTATIAADTDRIDVTVDRWAAGPATRPAATVVGRLELHVIQSVALRGPRTVRVWLPPGDDAKPRGVLYLFDGQNLFDRRTAAFGREWEVDETLKRLTAAGAVPPLIVVGLDNGPDRLAEYTFDADAAHGGGGRGAATAAFLLDKVMPWVTRTYQPVGRPMLGGSSLGGLLALDVARRHPGTFAGVAAVSPSLWWDHEATLSALAVDPSPLVGTRVWLDVGTAEEPGADGAADVERVRRLAAALDRGGVAHRLVVEPGAHHDEAAWAGRFPALITYLAGREADAK